MPRKRKFVGRKVLDWTSIITPPVSLYRCDGYVRHTCTPDSSCTCTRDGATARVEVQPVFELAVGAERKLEAAKPI